MKKNSQEWKNVDFGIGLLSWNREKNVRQMPWKGEKDPYKIWLSEIILQQTRVEQGLTYYKRFIKVFPDIKKLANASDEKIFKLWEGLGYYSRCRNLIITARVISKKYNGKFPDNYEEIRSLKGIGPYTAAAISSFAYNLPYAVVDGNVFRVLARIFGIDKPIDSTEGKKYFTTLAEELLDKKQAGLYNQAIMDFGAVVCKPAAPLCTECIFRQNCSAFLNNKVSKFPIKEKRITIKKRWFNYFVLEHNGDIAIQQRKAKDIWQDLYEFPLIETAKETNSKDVVQMATKRNWMVKKEYQFLSISPFYKQKLSHQLIVGQFIRIVLPKKPLVEMGWKWIAKNKFGKYPFPQIINQFLGVKDAR